MSCLTYRKLQGSDLNRIDEHLMSYFFTREPLGVALGATDHSLYKDWLREITSANIEQQASYGCFDGKHLAGLLINTIVYKDSTKNIKNIMDIIESRNLDHPLKKIFQFMKDVLYKDIDIFENTETVFYPYILSVDPTYVGKGIGRRVLELRYVIRNINQFEKSNKFFSEEEARSRGIKEVSSETTGVYSGKLFEKMGYKNLRSVAYNDTKATYFHNLGENIAANAWRKQL
uniref:N-acetyltransferase domain-containing protein n=1 Tax=Lepeophtheirus salmonis TaxID=72036 RepID=A0A0K2TQ38_LEPSM